MYNAAELFRLKGNFFVIMVFALLFSPLYAAVSQLHLSWQNDTSTTMTIMWSTPFGQTSPVAEYGTTINYARNATGTKSAHGVPLHTVEITGLKPDTLYHYRVSDDGGAWSSDYVFRTAPAPGTLGKKGSMEFTVVGDKSSTPDSVAINSEIAGQNALFHLVLGDLAYTYSDDTYHEWFNQQSVYAAYAPMMPVWGNHDKDFPAYDFAQSHFALPKKFVDSEEWFSYDVGNMHFIHIDSTNDTSPGSIQYQFIKNDLALAAANSKIKWIVALFHYTIYSAQGEHPDMPDLKANLQPLFDEYLVDLVLQGHNHNYARTMPLAYDSLIKDNKTDFSAPERYDFSTPGHGQIYLTAGGGGKSLYPCAKSSPWLIKCESAHSFAVITATATTLSGKSFYENGSLLDNGFIITKKERCELPARQKPPIQIPGSHATGLHQAWQNQFWQKNAVHAR